MLDCVSCCYHSPRITFPTDTILSWSDLCRSSSSVSCFSLLQLWRQKINQIHWCSIYTAGNKQTMRKSLLDLVMSHIMKLFPVFNYFHLLLLTSVFTAVTVKWIIYFSFLEIKVCSVLKGNYSFFHMTKTSFLLSSTHSPPLVRPDWRRCVATPPMSEEVSWWGSPSTPLLSAASSPAPLRPRPQPSLCPLLQAGG